MFRDSGFKLHVADDAEAPLAVARDVDAALLVTAEGRRAATRAGSLDAAGLSPSHGSARAQTLELGLGPPGHPPMGIGDGPGGLGASPISSPANQGRGRGRPVPEFRVSKSGPSPVPVGPESPDKSGTTGTGCPRPVTVSWGEWTRTSESLTSASGVINEIE